MTYKGEEIVFLAKYSMFILKTFTIVVSILCTIIIYFYSKAKPKSSNVVKGY